MVPVFVSGYEYIKNACTGPKTPEYFMFHDDDTMIRFSHLVDYLKTEVHCSNDEYSAIKAILRLAACLVLLTKDPTRVLSAGASTT
jgi:hypothetical protein